MLYLFLFLFQVVETEQGSVTVESVGGGGAGAPSVVYQLKNTVRTLVRSELAELNLTERTPRQLDRTDALLGGFNVNDEKEFPLHEPTGEKTRKTYDFTSSLP